MEVVRKQTAEKILDEAPDIATAATELFFKQRPELEAKYGKTGRIVSLQGVRDHLAHLSEAILSSSQTLFESYVTWAQEKLAARNIPASDLAVNLNCVKEILAQRLPIENYVIAAKYMNSALLQLEKKVTRQSSYLEAGAPLSSLARQYMNLLIEGDRGAASKVILDEVDKGTAVKDIYMHVFQPVQYEIGRLWQQAKLTVAQEHYCSAATQLIMSQLYYKIVTSEKNSHKLVAACVEGDMHEIGIRMVSDFLEMEGWHTYCLGANMPLSSIIKALHKEKPDLLLLSATMTYHLHAITELITAMHADPNLQHIKVMVGGQPFNIAPDLWKEIGADGYATNASDALEQANKLVSGAAGVA